MKRLLVLPAVGAGIGAGVRFWRSGMAWPVVTTFGRLFRRNPRPDEAARELDFFA